nr:uncharacterized protein LOC114827266 [Malus domestica]
MVTDSPEKWHETLGNTLWAYRTSKRAGTRTTPYALTFRQDAVLPMEINVSSVRIQNQFGLHSEEYIEAMCQRIEDLDVTQIEALNQIQEGKRAVARAYNKKVKLKSFKEGDLVWKAVLPLGAQLMGFGKWSPTWECPFIVSQVLDKGGYYLADLEGNWQKHPINVKFLKSFWYLHGQNLVRQVIGLCGQDELGKGPSIRIITGYDGEAQLIKATSRRANPQEKTA